MKDSVFPHGFVVTGPAKKTPCRSAYLLEPHCVHIVAFILRLLCPCFVLMDSPAEELRYWSSRPRY